MDCNLFFYRLALFLTFITTLFATVFVSLKGKRNAPTFYFVIFSLATAGWSITQFRLSYSTDSESALFYARLYHIIGPFIYCSFLPFVHTYIGLKNKRKITFLSYSVAALCLALVPFITKVKIQSYIGYINVPNVFLTLCYTLISLIVIYALYELKQSYKKTTSIKSKQLKFIFWSTLIGFISGSSNLLYPYHPIPIIQPFILFGLPIYVFIMTYAILKYKIMDINVVIKKAAIYGILYMFSLGIFFTLILLFGQWLILGNLDREAIFISIFAVIIVVSIINPLDKILTKITIKFLFRKKYVYQRALQEASTGMMRIRDLDKLTAFIISIITKTTGVKSANLYLLDEPTPGLSSLFQELTQFKKPLVGERLDTVSIPIVFKDKLTGILQLNEKTSGDIYTQEDLDLFSTLCAQAAIAIENAKAYRELVKTKEKLFEAEKFAAIGQLAGGIAHEIKNPLVAIKTFTEYMNRKFGDPEFRKKFQRIVGSEVDRINYIVEQLVSYANPKQTIPEPTSLHSVIDETIFLIEEEAKKNDIQITKQYSPLNLLLNIDPKQLKQILLNLFLNSIQAMEDKKIGPKELTIATDKQDKSLIIKISDTGKGIPPAQLPRIFEPFFTTKESGTGLGLAMSKNIVDNYHGEIRVESETGVGTTFILNFPI